MTTTSANAKPPYWVYAYFNSNVDTNGAAINLSTGIPWSDITHIGDAFAIPNTSAGIDMTGTQNTTMINAAHANHTRCFLSIGGAGSAGNFGPDTSSTNVTTFVANIAKAVTQYGYDGVDIDWEFPTAAQKSQNTTFMQDLYTAIHALPNSTVDGLPRTLTFFIAAGYDVCGVDWTVMGNYCDAGVMSGYDYFTDVYNGPVSGEPSGTDCGGTTYPVDIAGQFTKITSTIGSFPPSKLVLGCPLYGNRLSSGTEVAIETLIKGGTAGAYQTAQMETLYSCAGDQTTANLANSFCDKINWALGKGMKGIGLWEIDQACPYTDSTVTLLWNTIGGNNACVTTGGATSTFTTTPTNTATRLASNTATPTFTWTYTPTNTPLNAFTSTPTSTFTTGPLMNACSHFADWSAASVVYSAGTTVVYGTEMYKCIQSHTSNYNWSPTTTTSLWQDAGVCTGATSTPGPLNCSNAPTWSSASVSYALGSQVIYGSVLYQCIRAHTSSTAWTPASQPTLWQNQGSCSTGGVNTATNTATNTPTLTMTNTPSITFTNTATRLASNTATFTATWTYTRTNTPINALTNTPTSTFTSGTLTNACANFADWSAAAVVYSAGTTVVDGTEMYKCIQSHTSNYGWPPTTTTSLWQDAGACMGATSTPGPLNCSNAPTWSSASVSYALGSQVIYSSVLYQCIRAHTSSTAWTPASQPTLWQNQGSCLTGNVNMALVVGVSQGPETNTPTPSFTPTITMTKTLTPTNTPSLAGGLLRSVVAAPNLSRGGEPIHLRIILSSPANVQISIFSVTGGLVYQDSFEGNAGLNTMTWYLRNRLNEVVSSGLYVYVIQVNDGSLLVKQTGKVVLLH